MQKARTVIECGPITLKRRDAIVLLIICGVALLVTLALYVDGRPIQKTQHLLSYIESRLTQKPTKHILFYNDFFGAKDWNLGEGDAIFQKLQCPVRDCAITSDKGNFHESAAVVFHVPRMGTQIPKGRPKDQVWIFYAWEAPTNIKKLPGSWRHQFNWSLTYHRKSDFFMPYGAYIKRKIPQTRNWTEVVLRKSKGVAWFASNCKTPSNRREYVDRMNKIIPVDIFGGCGPNKCGVYERQKCMNILNETYKFYLAFENSFCEDYVTEKLFRYAMYDMVVVVRGASNYTAYTPPNAFINTADYNSPEDLAKYLKYLDETPSEHIKYLQWKDNYYAQEFGLKQLAWCDICRRLHNISDSQENHTNPYDLWFDEGRCWTPTDI